MEVREPAAGAVRAWLGDLFAPRLCLVTGAPGTGKSSLVSAVITAEPEAFNAVTTAAGLTADVAAWALADQLTLAPADPETLVAQVTADTRPVRIAVGELDEAGPGCDGAGAAEIVARLLRPLAALPHVRLLAEARPEYAALFDGLPSKVLDLDAPELTDRAAFAARYGHGAAFPNPGLAWAMSRAGAQNPAPGPVAPDPAGGDPARDVWRRWIEARPLAARPALDALGFAYGMVDATTWELITTALVGDAGRARSSVAVAASLLEGEPYALPSRPLREATRAAFPEPARVHHAITLTLHAAGRADWSRASRYIRRNLIRHARAAGIAGPLFEDTALLLHTDAAGMAAMLEGPVRPVWRSVAPWLVAVGDRDRDRAGIARMAAARHGDAELTRHLCGAVPAWDIGWIDGPPTAAGSPDWKGQATALARGSGPWEGQLIIAGRYGQLRAVSPAMGSAQGRIVADGVGADTRHLAPLPGGAIITLDSHRALLLIEGEDAQSSAGRLNSLLNASPAPRIDAPAVLAAVRTHPRLTSLAGGEGTVTAGDDSGNVHVWPLTGGGEPTAVTARLHQGPVTAVACTRPNPGVTLVVSGGADGAVRLSSPGAGPMDEPVERRATPVTAVTAARIGTRPVFAAAWGDGLIQIWDLVSGAAAPLRLGFPVHAMVLYGDGVLAVAATDLTAAVRLDLDRLLPAATGT